MAESFVLPVIEAVSSLLRQPGRQLVHRALNLLIDDTRWLTPLAACRPSACSRFPSVTVRGEALCTVAPRFTRDRPFRVVVRSSRRSPVRASGFDASGYPRGVAPSLASGLLRSRYRRDTTFPKTSVTPLWLFAGRSCGLLLKRHCECLGNCPVTAVLANQIRDVPPVIVG